MSRTRRRGRAVTAQPHTPASVQGTYVAAYPPMAPEAAHGTVRPITETGAEVLHRPCEPVTEFGTPELAALVADAFRTMYAADGVGLAANQIGVGLRVFVYDCTDDDGRHVGHVVNPVLERLGRVGRLSETLAEGCLSVPGPTAELSRAARARVRGRDLHGRPVAVEGDGYFARCLQHETDHLDGRLYTDLLPDGVREGVLAEMRELRPEVLTRRASRAAELGPLLAGQQSAPGAAPRRRRR